MNNKEDFSKEFKKNVILYHLHRGLTEKAHNNIQALILTQPKELIDKAMQELKQNGFKIIEEDILCH